MARPARALIDAFEEKFKTSPDIYRAPGRVNLIGEHTDYNLGFVLPVAIDLACYTASAPNRDGVLRVFSQNLGQGRLWPIEEIAGLKPSGEWTDYVIGVARQLPLHRGRNVMIDSTVPVGAGLSSSAALEVSVALALGWNGEQPGIELAKLCRRAESDFIGLPSGIMDQYVSVFGREKAAVKIDCRSLEREFVELPSNVALVAVNSMVKHELGNSSYRQRVAECAGAVEAIRSRHPEVQSLRDITTEQLVLIDDPVARRRARHVISENARVLDFIRACHSGDLAEMGRLFVESHRSLQQDYEVSCGELDFLVDTALSIPGVYGARMTGGGFGGCTVNLVERQHVEGFETRMRNAYQKKSGMEPACYRVEASAGAARIS